MNCLIKKNAFFVLLVLLFLNEISNAQIRVVISSDFPPTDVCMSGCAADHTSDPDDVQSMVRFLLYTNELDVEGLICSSGTFANVARKQNILDMLDLYAKVYPNLKAHDPEYPSPDFLRSVTFQGRSGTWGGTVANNIGSGKDSEASNAIISIIDKPDTRPVWFCFWGDCSNLAQAIWKVQNTRSAAELKVFLSKIRIFQIAHQDDTIDWLLTNFPDLFIIYSKSTYMGIFGGSGDPLGSQTWLNTNIRQNHGPLGAVYPPEAMGVDGLKEGDSPSFMYLISAIHGMNNPEDPTQQSWGGQYVRSGTTNHWIDGVGASTVSKWKTYYQAEFAQRADWMLPITTGRSPSFKTFMNPVIPGDHADCSLTRVGNDFYSSGSSYWPTPVIYHSTDLVHWEAIAQPVSAAWTGYDDKPGGGCVEGSLVYYNNKYWDFFSNAFSMYFVTAGKPEGPWSMPTQMKCPASVPGLGWDNSIFIDTDGKWYLLVKNGQVNNWILELGKDGQPAGAIYNLTWLNPAPDYPYSWAEGPVMWKSKGYYYYSFAINVSGGQKVMRSKTLTDTKSAWEMLGDLFNQNDPNKSGALFIDPNHSSSVLTISDSTSWLAHPEYAKGEWKGQGRQGLLNQVRYDSNLKPVADYPTNQTFTAPKLPSSGIPWMVPHSDSFTADKLHPEWSFLGYTHASTYSLADRPGWLRMSPKSSSKANTILKNDGEHNYSLVTRLEFHPKSKNDEAGLRILRGDATKFVKLASSQNTDGKKVIFFSFDNTRYELENTVGDTLWLKMIRVNHKISGYLSGNGNTWTKIGQDIDIASVDSYTDPNFQIWEGTRQGLYVQGSSPAWFDLYIYRDAYSPILAECPANQYGTTRTSISSGNYVLDNIHNNDWALFAGVEFGSDDYTKSADSIQIIAASTTYGGAVEVWLDSIDTGNKIGTCYINSTGSTATYKTFSAKIKPTTGMHDVYLKFTGTGSVSLFRLQWLKFITARTDYTATLHELKKGKSVTVYPNPTQSILNVQSEAEFDKLTIFDMEGHMLLMKNYDEKIKSTSLQLNFTRGLYLIRLCTIGLSAYSKFIIE
jgi:beta-xylosidase